MAINVALQTMYFRNMHDYFEQVRLTQKINRAAQIVKFVLLGAAPLPDHFVLCNDEALLQLPAGEGNGRYEAHLCLAKRFSHRQLAPLRKVDYLLEQLNGQKVRSLLLLINYGTTTEQGPRFVSHAYGCFYIAAKARWYIQEPCGG